MIFLTKKTKVDDLSCVRKDNEACRQQGVDLFAKLNNLVQDIVITKTKEVPHEKSLYLQKLQS